MFNFCNYRIVLVKVSRVILGLFLLILLFMRLIFLLVNFCRTIKVVNVYFIVYD
jgi:hypothetical protein